MAQDDDTFCAHEMHFTANGNYPTNGVGLLIRSLMNEYVSGVKGHRQFSQSHTYQDGCNLEMLQLDKYLSTANK